MNKQDLNISYNIIAAILYGYLGMTKNNYETILKDMYGLNNFNQCNNFIKEYLEKIKNDYTLIIKF